MAVFDASDAAVYGLILVPTPVAIADDPPGG